MYGFWNGYINNLDAYLCSCEVEGAVDIMLPEIYLSLEPTGLRKKISCPGLSAGSSLVLCLQLKCSICDCFPSIRKFQTSSMSMGVKG